MKRKCCNEVLLEINSFLYTINDRNSNVTRQCPQKVQSGCTWPGPIVGNRSDGIFGSPLDIIIITIVGKNFMTNTSKNYTIDISKIGKSVNK